MVLGDVDWQPLITAAAALVIAVTPVLVALLQRQVAAMDERATADRRAILAKVDQVDQKVGVVQMRGDGPSRTVTPGQDRRGGGA